MTMDRVSSAVAGAAVLVVGLLEAMLSSGLSNRLAPTLIVVGTAAAVGFARRMPILALLLLWAVCVLQLLRGSELMLVQLAIVYVAFAAARWGSRTALWLSALSIPVAAGILLVMVGLYGVGGLHIFGGSGEAVASVLGYDARSVVVFVVGLAALSAPWLAGLAFRFGVDARRSRVLRREAEASTARADRELAQAREIMRLREEQAQLANDVHDVVGHSLAVILAQAESAQYLDRADTEVLRQTMAKIATAARSSLRDVRQVLSETAGQGAAAGAGAPEHESSTLSSDLDGLVESVRESGHSVESSVIGEQRPLAPELETVVFRVLQEMLTNAIRHGRRDRPIVVERTWADGLRLRVSNSVAVEARGGADEARAAEQAEQSGFGLDGMRRRLQSVGGSLEILRDGDAALFTAVARLPYRAVIG